MSLGIVLTEVFAGNISKHILIENVYMSKYMWNLTEVYSPWFIEQ